MFFHGCDSDKPILESDSGDSTFHRDSATIYNMSEPTDEDWKRLGARLTRQRLQLGYDSRPKFVEGKKLKHGRIVADLETGARSNYDPGTLIQYELLYEWGPGSVSSVLAGGEPTLMKDLARGLGGYVTTSDDDLEDERSKQESIDEVFDTIDVAASLMKVASLRALRGNYDGAVELIGVSRQLLEDLQRERERGVLPSDDDLEVLHRLQRAQAAAALSSDEPTTEQLDTDRSSGTPDGMVVFEEQEPDPSEAPEQPRGHGRQGPRRKAE